jgi:lipoprotein NlpD
MPKNYRVARALSLVVLLVGGCASTGPAPVEDLSLGNQRSTTRATPRLAQEADRYRVERGDTLYSIAFRHGVDYRELAQWNGIDAPYTIYVGQELRLANAPRATSAQATTPRASTSVAHAPSSAPPATRPASPSTPMPTPFEPVAAGSASTPTHASAPTTVASAVPAPPPMAAQAPPKAPIASPPAAPPAREPVANGEIAWRWPADGRIVAGYVAGDQTRQGIDIAGKAGDPVRAAADGTVVYSGNGLIGYGELIIIKHSPAFLSAYGHNRKRLVKEGDRVKSGQLVAEMGSSSASRDSLHFEIRRNGKPANPIDYLPRR